jgi:hypothetical protein
MRKEAAMPYFEVLSHKPYGRIEENRDKPARIADLWTEI